MSAYDVFLADCPARTTLELVGSTWAVVVVVALGERPRRYGELRDRIGGVSNKMLTQTLRRLERNELVQRAPAGRGAGSSGARVYRLTALGASLLEPVAALSRWAEEHTPALLAARHADQAPKGSHRPPTVVSPGPDQDATPAGGSGHGTDRGGDRREPGARSGGGQRAGGRLGAG